MGMGCVCGDDGCGGYDGNNNLFQKDKNILMPYFVHLCNSIVIKIGFPKDSF